MRKRRIEKVISASAKKYDLVVFSGGTSVGNKDFGYEVVNRLGEVFVRGVAIKPGKPVLFGTVGKCGVFGMPGYPTSCLLTAELFLAPAVRRLAHSDHHDRVRLPAKLGHEIKQDKTKQQIVPVRIDGTDWPGAHSKAAAISPACRRVSASFGSKPATG